MLNCYDRSGNKKMSPYKFLNKNISPQLGSYMMLKLVIFYIVN